MRHQRRAGSPPPGGRGPYAYIFSKRAHGFGGDDGSLASGKGDLGLINVGQNFGAAALTLFPERHRLRRGVLGPRIPSGVDGLADKCFLVVGRANGMGEDQAGTSAAPGRESRRPMRSVGDAAYAAPGARAERNGIVILEFSQARESFDIGSQPL
jgi:hypothetical protein